MPTVSDLIHSSFRLIGAIAAGETLETNELNDAHVSLNQLIASWNTEGLTLAGRQLILMPLSQFNSYMLTPRPVKIDAASVHVNEIDNPLEIVDAAGWEAITEKDMLAVQTKKLFCDYMYPTSRVYIWPTPRIGGGTLELFIYYPILQFIDLNQTIDLPPGYEQALRYNFAIAVLPEYPRSQVDPTLPAQATNYKASLVQLNASNHAITQQPVAIKAIAAQGTP